MTGHRRRDALKEPFERDEVAEWWGTIEGRLATRRARARRPALVAIAAAATLAAGAALALGWQGRPEAPGAQAVAVGSQRAPGAQGPLSLAGEAVALDDFRGARERGVAVELSDRSRIVSQGPVELRLLENSGTRFEVKQGHGQVRYEISPGGPRRWSIDCALATVEVVGTAFSIDSDVRRLRVQVERGAVLVRGERVPERVQRLSAGDEIVISVDDASGPPRVDASAALAPARPDAPATQPPRPDAPRPEATRGEARPDAPRPGAPRPDASQGDGARGDAPRPWRELASKGAFKDAYSELGAGGVARASSEASIDDLFALADVARFSGHPHEAVGPLTQIVQRGGGRAALAAFTLGRVRMDQLGDPATAAQDFDRAVGLGLGGGLREDALVRRVEALARSGQGQRAAEAARLFAEQHPASKKRVEKWLHE